MQKTFWIASVMLALAPAAPALDAPGKVRPGSGPIEVRFVISRYQAEKKLSSVPYALSCPVGETEPARVRVGVDVPLFTKINDVPQVIFKTVGTGVDCMASEIEPGLYRLALNADQTSIYVPKGEPGAWSVPEGWLGQHPWARSLRASFVAALREGETAQQTTATDPLTGEVVKIDVTLSRSR
jgi:hypothetical protein